MIAFESEVRGTPAGWPRPRAQSVRGHARIFNARTGPPAVWRQAMTLAFRRAMVRTLRGPCAIELSFRFARPKSHTGKRGLKPSAPAWHTAKPDVDNLAKLALDALVDARVLLDDCQVVAMHAAKRWCANGEAAGCWAIVHDREGES